MHPRGYFLSGTNSTTSQANQCISRHRWAPTSRSTSAVQWNCAGFQATQHMVANGTCTLLSHTVVFDTIDTHVLCSLIDVLFSHVSLCAVFSHICAVLSHTCVATCIVFSYTCAVLSCIYAVLSCALLSCMCFTQL
jgi:hypothetical protein